jgi:hypothetical protein
MFEREIQRAKELLQQRMAAAAQFVYWDEIRRRADIPVFYRNFFGAEAQWWVFDQQMQRSANPRFDDTHEQIARLANELDHYLLEAARFDHQDLTSTLDLAVKTRFNYILRPRTTLKWFVYRGEPTKTLREVMLRMDYFLEYDYLLDGFRRWMNDKQQEKQAERANENAAKSDVVRTFSPTTSLISVIEFDRVLQNVDNDVILEYSPEEFTDLLTPMFEMFDEIHAADRTLQQYRGKVPTPALIIFLDDKGIYRIAQELEELMKTRSLRYVGQREFLHVLNDIVNKLELAVTNELPRSSETFTDTATLPLDFIAPEEPILKADDTIGELAIGTAIRTKRPSILPLADETKVEQKSEQIAEPIIEQKVEAEQKIEQKIEQKVEVEQKATPQLEVENDDTDFGEVELDRSASNHQPSAPIHHDLPLPEAIAPANAPNTHTPSVQAASEVESAVIDAEFEITEPSMATQAERTFDQSAFSAQAAELATMLNEISNGAPSVESVPNDIVKEVAKEAAKEDAAEEQKNTFFTRWGNIFGTPRPNE